MRDEGIKREGISLARSGIGRSAIGQALFLHRSFQWRNGAGLLFDVWVLVLVEVLNLYVLRAVSFIPDDEPFGLQLRKQLFDIAAVIRQNLRLDFFRPLLKPALSVCPAPQTGEQNACERLAVGKIVAGEEPRFDVPRPRHRPNPLSVPPRISMPSCYALCVTIVKQALRYLRTSLPE